jgi:hypothetical protein
MVNSDVSGMKKYKKTVIIQEISKVGRTHNQLGNCPGYFVRHVALLLHSGWLLALLF